MLKRTALLYLLLLLSANLYAKPVDISIALLPPEDISLEAKRLNSEVINKLTACGMKLHSEINNYPHISIFRARFDEKDIPNLERIIYHISKVATPFEVSLPNSLDIRYNHAGWYASFNPKMNLITNAIIQYALPLSHNRFLMHQDSKMSMLSVLNETQINLLDQFGASWLISSFDPNITIYYDLPLIMPCVKNAVETPLTTAVTFKAKYIAIGEIGPHGNLYKIQTVYALNQDKEKAHD